MTNAPTPILELATEATRCLEVIDLFRSLELNVKWRSEADEVVVTLVGLPWLGVFLANGPADEIRATKRHQFLGQGGPDDPVANDPVDGSRRSRCTRNV